jgi:hypothetical protein
MMERIIRQGQLQMLQMRTQADGMVEMHEKALGKQQLCELLDDLIDVRCDAVASCA